MAPMPERSDASRFLPILNQSAFDDPAEEAEALDVGEEPRTVLITGAAGNLGSKLRAAWSDRYELILLDRKDDDPEIVTADLAEFSDDWAALFHEVDVVVHLAANPNEFSSWPELVGPNLDALSHVIHASALAGIDRLIFAGSNHAMGGYRDLAEPRKITEALPPLPGNAYGVTKLMGERFGIGMAQSCGVEFLALRLGWVQRGENRPETLPDDWARGLWLSNRDLVALFTRAIEAELVEPFAVLNGLSRNTGSRWDLERTIAVLGYEPQDDAFA